MTIIRSPRAQRDFTIISNSVCLDSRLSMRALGLLVRLLGRPDNWQTNSQTLAREFDCGREQMQGVLRELSSAGYLELRKDRTEDGTFCSRWYVYDEPKTTPRTTANQRPETRMPVDQSLSTRTDLTRTDTNPQTPQGLKAGSDEKTKDKARAATTLKTWLEEIKAKKEDAIPATGAVMSYADSIKLPDHMLALAWATFKSRHMDGAKKYKDWRRTFLDALKNNYLRLWWIDGEGRYQLTTQGKQAEMIHGGGAA